MSDGQLIFVAVARSRRTGEPYLIVQIPGKDRPEIRDLVQIPDEDQPEIAEPRRRLVPRSVSREIVRVVS